MTWQLLNVEPIFGVCDLCKKDTCGIVDGQHVWVRLNNVVDKYEDPAVIGYKCIKEIADNLGFTKPDEVVKEVVRPPTDEEIGKCVRELFHHADPLPRWIDDDNSNTVASDNAHASAVRDTGSEVDTVKAASATTRTRAGRAK